MDDSDEDYIAPSRSGNRNSPDDLDQLSSDDELMELDNKNGNGEKSGSGYAWEDRIQRSWDIVKDDEDSSHSLESIIQTMIENRKKKIMKISSTPFQRGIIRTLIVVIDGSLAMLSKDLRPTRFSMMLSILQEFIVEFFDQNPISQIGIVMMRNGVSTLVSEVSGLPQHHIDRIRQLKVRQHNRYEPLGDPSLQNALEISRSLLSYNFGSNSTNSKNSKEILIIFGALFTSDPGDIKKTIENLVREEIKVKVIGLSAKVAICQELVNRTNHTNNLLNSNYYGVILNEHHFKELLMDSVVPLPISESEKKKKEELEGVPLLKMGFPSKLQQYPFASSALNVKFPQLCACHPTSGSEDSKNVIELSNEENPSESSITGYQCPQCKNKICHLPTVCPICGLMLILSTHLARSYHHLVPLKEYVEVPVSESYDSMFCYGCLLKFPEGVKEANMDSFEGHTSSRYKCPKCTNDFCIDCDVFVHEVLHNCPGCDNK